MMGRIKPKWVVLALVLLAHLTIPLILILNFQIVLGRGEDFKILARPIDPTDPFRGKYVALQLELEVPKWISVSASAETIWVRLEADIHGFASIIELTDYELKGPGVLKISHPNFRRDKLILPYDRYYMEEGIAYQAEIVAREFSDSTYVVLTVKDKIGLLSGLYLSGIRIEDYISLLEKNEEQ